MKISGNTAGGVDVDRYLEDLESRMDPDEELRIRDCWRRFLESGAESGEEYFSCVRRPVPASAFAPFPTVSINAAIRSSDFAPMLCRQLAGVEALITGTAGWIPMIRADYGAVILPVALGCELRLMAEEHHTLPGAVPLPGGVAEARRRTADGGLPDWSRGYAGKVFDCVAYFREKLKDYPKLRRFVKIYHPDFQGPLDIAEVWCGSEIFTAFYDDPGGMAGVLEFIVRVFCSAMDRYLELVPPEEADWGFHYGWMHRGQVRLSLDSCVNFSPEMYREMILPHDRVLMERYGGVIHSCGHVDHFVEVLPELGPGYCGFNLSQPHLNDMEKVFRATVDRGIRIFSLPRVVAETALAQGRPLRGLVAVV